MNRNWKKLRNHSSIKLRDIEDLVTPLCPIMIYYNNELVWDDTAEVGQANTIDEYIHFWSIHANDIIDKYSVDIRDFHHSIIKIWSVHE